VPLHFDASTSYDNVEVISYEWDFGDGSSYKGEYENVTHTYSIPGTYTVNLTVKDAAGHEDSFESQITVVDRTPPASPKGLIVTQQPGGNSLEISWEGVSDPDLNHYDIYVSINEGEFTKANEVPISKDKPSFLHSGLSMGSGYRYYVVAYDNSENDSPQSPIVEGYPDIDTDSDGVYDREDEDDDDDGLTDYQEYEEATDPKNPDTDSDGRVDGEDAFPHDETEFRDSDFDGVGDTKDAFPKDATEWKDSDGDGIGDSVDFLPIHNLFFYLIIAIVIIVIIAVSMAMVKRRRTASVSFDGDMPKEQVPENQAPPPDFDAPVEESKEVLPPPPRKNLPPPSKKR
jgi:PKD repeat protein